MSKRDAASMKNGLPDDIVQALDQAQQPAMDAAPALSRIKTRLLGRIAQQAAQLHTIRAGEGEWEIFVPGVQIKVLQRQGETQSYLLKFEPGAVVPGHRHPQTEECVVLAGELRLGNIVATAGTYHRAPAALVHDAISSPTGALIYLRGGIPAASDVRLVPSTLWAMAPQSVKQVAQTAKRFLHKK
jgi:anti-sigma factor ChrR (cupin superfamily)